MVKRSKSDDALKRDGTNFFTMPHVVMRSQAYIGLSHPAKALLFELALQINGANNGDLDLTHAAMAPRGWTSNDVLYRARDQLIEAGFIVETVKGRRPNKPSLFALTWRDLDHCKGKLELTQEQFKRHHRGAYQRYVKGSTEGPRKRDSEKNASPLDGVGAPSIAPAHGVETAPTTPPDGAIRPVFAPRLHRQTVTYLGLPSDAERAAVNA